MRYTVLKSFAGIKVRGSENEIIELNDKDLEMDLLNAKYIEPIETKKKVEKAVKKVG